MGRSYAPPRDSGVTGGTNAPVPRDNPALKQSARRPIQVWIRGGAQMSEGTAGFRARKLLRGPRGKTDQSPELHADVPALQIELCQILPLSDTTALLRVAGRWSGAARTDVGLVVGRSAPRAPLAPGPA